MNLLGLTFLAHLAPLARPLLRGALGAIVALHASSALTLGAHEGLAAWLRTEGAPVPAVLADVVAGAQIAAALALVLGLFTRLGALVVVLSASLAVALGAPSAPTGTGELEVALVAAALALAVLGPGALSLDHALGIDRSDAERRSFKSSEGRSFASPAAARRVTRRPP